MAKSEFTLAFNEITEAHHLPRDVVIEALQQALVSAFRKDSSASPAQRIDAEVDPTTNRYRILVEKEVVDSVVNRQTEVLLEEARQQYPEAQIGDMVMALEETSTKTFGRIAAQTAKQVILQKIREAERRSLYEEYKDREGDLVTGQVQSLSGQNVTLSLGRAEAIMPFNQQIRGERYRPHDKVRTLILEVRESTRGPQIVVSRAHKNMLRRLLEYEVPEIYNGQVEIKSIAREPGHRSKVAVAALQPGVDPVGACVGMRGMRIQNIVKELNEEKIDVIEWSADPAVFIAKALSPARVTGVYLEEDIDQGNTATVIVPDDQLSLAIGREGQNARLAAKLTGWRIDIKSVTEAAFDAVAHIAEPPFDKLAQEHPDLVTEVNRILDKKRAERTVMPEEYHTLARFVQIAEQRLLEQREVVRSKRRKALEKVRPSMPRGAFQMELKELELARDITQALMSRNIANVGELMVRLQAERETLAESLQAAGAGADAMEAIQDAIDSLVLEDKQPESDMLDAGVAEVAAVAEAEPVEAEPAQVASDAQPVLAGEDEEAPPAFVDLEQKPRPEQFPPAAKPARPIRPIAKPEPSRVEEPELETSLADDTSEASRSGKKKGGKGKQRSRELIFDESRGEVVTRRKRKGSRGFQDWGEGDLEE
jgi:N utilization substance protein A